MFAKIILLLGLLPPLAPPNSECPEIRQVSIVSVVDSRGVADAERKLVKTGETVTLAARVEATVAGGGKVVYCSATLPGSAKALAPDSWPKGCSVSIKWDKVEAEVESYSNPGGSPAETISYRTTPWKNGWTAVADVHPTLMHNEFKSVSHGYGVMRHRVTVEAGGVKKSSPGTECRESGAICRSVHTVAYRKDDSYLGYLYELFNTPYIYGSKRIKGGHQSDLLVGSDCADFAVYGKRRERGAKQFDYTYTGGLCRYGKCIAVTVDPQGYYVDKKGKRLPFGAGEAVRPGDLLNFMGGHVGVLAEDNGNGVLDEKDFLMHTFVREPETVPISECRWPHDIGNVVRWYR